MEEVLGRKENLFRWQCRVKVVKGKASADSSDYDFQIDGLSGATLTSRGVENMVAYWLGKDGFGPVLAKLGR